MPDAGRVIAGTARGIRLLAPGPGTRPLGDRVKQTLFAILEPDLPDARILDLFAGSGAAGIEALSRGAALVSFVERDATAIQTIRENIARTHLDEARAQVIRADVVDWLEGYAGARAGAEPTFDVVILDPPYDEGPKLLRALDLLGRLDAPLADGARVVAKHAWQRQPPAVVGLLASERERRFGETALTFYRRQEAGSTA